VIRAEQVLPGSEGRWGRGAGEPAGRNCPSHVCTYEINEYKTKKRKERKVRLNEVK
jgi:hypothetical protein